MSHKVTLPDGTKITGFEHKWGIDAITLAKLEGVTPDAIHMRCYNYKTPFKRRSKETMWEKLYGKTIVELANEQDCHPITIANKHYKFGDVYAKTDQRFAAGKYCKSDWRKDPKWIRAGKSTYFTLADIL